MSPRKDWAAIAAELVAQPKRWAVVETGMRSLLTGLSQQINTGHLMAFRPRGHFEACTRSANDEMVVYARYIGAPAPAKKERLR